MWVPAYLANLATANYGMWDAPDPALHPDGSITPGEGGVDVGVANGTPVLAIADGTIIASGYWNDLGHGVVTTRVNVPGSGPQDLYYQHIQIDPSIKTGQQVTRGQQIGVIGPYNEIEMGFNAQWGGVWGTGHPGPWVKDPRPWLNAILSGSGAAPAAGGATTPGTVAATGTGNPLDALKAIGTFFQKIGAITAWINNPVRIVKLVNGVFFLGIAIFLLVSKSETVANIEGAAAKAAML
jgi:hypothetical protein